MCVNSVSFLREILIKKKKKVTNYVILNSPISASIRIGGQNSVDDPWLLVFQNLNVANGDDNLRCVIVFVFHSTEDGGGAGQ